MQKRLKGPGRVDFQAITLPADFPVRLYHRTWMRGDRPYVPAPHVHNALELGYCHEGRGTFIIGKKILPFRAGQAVVITGREPHFGQNAAGVDSIWTWLFFDPVQLLGSAAEDLGVLAEGGFCGRDFVNLLTREAQADSVDLIRQLIEECAGKAEHYRSAGRGLALALLARLHRLPGVGAAEGATEQSEAFGRLRPALDHIQRHYRERLDVGRLARLCHLSVPHFRLVFRRTTDQSPYQYLQCYRIARAAADLAETDRTVEAVAQANGFPTLSCFLRQFKAQIGQAPRQWARRVKQAKVLPAE